MAEAETFDEDDVLISITVNLDKGGDLYELDIWKVDFSAVKRFPSIDNDVFILIR
ncbi:DUF6984 family protein [Mucilaginibacter limnophilus]|uniref:DUF6984 family protein n=1 Tax=Mucilaginibacter limnophilus TaxID=1932778 RepID=UPI0013E2E922|nr:hypothetical protein [Mucilaginibacter limnophilus]